MNRAYSHIMIDLILVDENTSVFGNEVAIQGCVSCGTSDKKIKK